MTAYSGTPSRDDGLGAYLRSRRAALDPGRVGLIDDGRPRKVPGLRREELAQLAHVSVDYVVRLEQGRTRRVSRTVLDALADALLLAPDERAHLHALAYTDRDRGRDRDRDRGSAPRSEAAPRLRQLLESMHDVPAMVLHRGMDVLAWNRGAVALLTDFGALPPAGRNLIRLTFLEPSFRALYADWPRVARECVAVLRMEAGRSPGDPALAALVDELSARDTDFRDWWAGHQVRGPRQLTKTYHHPVAGSPTLDVQQFTVDTHPEQMLVAYTAPPGTASHEALRFLLQWSTGGPASTRDEEH